VTGWRSAHPGPTPADNRAPHARPDFDTAIAFWLVKRVCGNMFVPTVVQGPEEGGLWSAGYVRAGPRAGVDPQAGEDLLLRSVRRVTAVMV
jgi:hypothetical protein